MHSTFGFLCIHFFSSPRVEQNRSWLAMYSGFFLWFRFVSGGFSLQVKGDLSDNFLSLFLGREKMKCIAFAVMVLLLVGCGKEQVEIYDVPKEKRAEAPPVKMLAAPLQLGFTADLPAGWTERPGQGMRIVSYAIEGASIDLYAIKLGMGDLTSNVNRWRGQVDLPEASAEAIAAAAKPLMANGAPVQFVELLNEEADKGILAAIVDRAPMYWYFTAKGSVAELKAHSADMQRFINSIRFE